MNESEVKNTSKVESTSNVKEVNDTSVIVVSSDEYVSQCTSREKRAIRWKDRVSSEADVTNVAT